MSAFEGIVLQNYFARPSAVDVVAKSPPQHGTRVGKPRKVTRKKPAKTRCLVLLSALTSHFCL
jgi:hypothetical protein